MPVPNLVKVVAGRTDAYLAKVIKFGGSAVGLTSFMPAFGFNMEDQQVWDLVAYLRVLQRAPKGRARSDVQTPASPVAGIYRTVGKGLYEERCVLCHGPQGRGWDWSIKAKKPPVPIPNLAEAVPHRSDDFLIDIIRFGGRAVGLTPFMPAFDFNMREQQVWDLVSYLRNLSGPDQRNGLISQDVSGMPLPGRRPILFHQRALLPRHNPWLRFAEYSQGAVSAAVWPRTARVGPEDIHRRTGLSPGDPNSWMLAHQGESHGHGNSAAKGPVGHHAGYFPHAVAVADFNGDGIPDLAIPAAGERKVAILLGDGKASVSSNHSYPVGKGPTWVDVGDFNRDGNLDIVVTNTGAGTLTLYYGDGSGGMKNRQDIKGIHGPSSVVVLDMNHDGLPDLAVAQAAQARIAILFSDAKGPPRLRHTIDVNPGPHILDKTDFNGDGLEDLVVGSLGTHTLSIILGTRGQSPASPIVVKVGRFPHYRVYDDFNGDGRMDAAVVVAGDDAVQIYLGDGKGNLRKSASFPAGVNPHGMVGGDFNRDGKADLCVSTRSSQEARVLLGNGKGKFTALPPISTGQDIITLAGADFNRDGNKDLAMISASSNSVIFYIGDGKGNFRPVNPN